MGKLYDSSDTCFHSFVGNLLVPFESLCLLPLWLLKISAAPSLTGNALRRSGFSELAPRQWLVAPSGTASGWPPT